jgi:hypothetical protein
MIERVQEAFELGFTAGQLPRRQDTYTWCAIYDDGHTVISESDVGSFADIHCADIPSSRVQTLLLLPMPGIERDLQRMDIPQDATPVFFRRRSVEINPLQGNARSRPTVHCIGWKRGDEATYLFVFDDGSTLLTDNLQAV